VTGSHELQLWDLGCSQFDRHIRLNILAVDKRGDLHTAQQVHLWIGHPRLGQLWLTCTRLEDHIEMCAKDRCYLGEAVDFQVENRSDHTSLRLTDLHLAPVGSLNSHAAYLVLSNIRDPEEGHQLGLGLHWTTLRMNDKGDMRIHQVGRVNDSFLRHISWGT
jgi:hypothetical protein